MLYEKDSPPLQSYHPPRWNTSRQNNARTRMIIIIGILIVMITSLTLLMHYSDIPPADLQRLNDIDLQSDSSHPTSDTIDLTLPTDLLPEDDFPPLRNSLTQRSISVKFTY